jgi:hypothetical protein
MEQVFQPSISPVIAIKETSHTNILLMPDFLTLDPCSSGSSKNHMKTMLYGIDSQNNNDGDFNAGSFIAKTALTLEL